ncbi:related to lipase [Sporisorium reilianum f. sp. reilianum]|uniref:Related to lipase n=1 Tax=Sporisorium reilianum f. sp. reilianum TaxID=72559 RepID=A0A2N8U6V5_9BASI|nr:related to lipase [Sporisorium reilianum f. sp. reilianum]
MPSIWPFTGTGTESPPPTDPSSSSSSSSTAPPIPPLIICEGFLSAAQSVVWGNEFRTYLGVGHQQLVDELHPQPRRRSRRSEVGSDRTVVFAPIGPVSSLHDRACELFFALRGGTVDYGEALCPQWQRGLPAHFLGHSLGGPTILKLQQLLRLGFFDRALGREHDADWKAEDLVLSITSVSSPFRGTPLVYSLGSEPLPYPKVRMFSFGDLLSKFVHIAAFLDLPFFDAHADAWHFSARRRKAVQRSLLPGGVATQTTPRKERRTSDPEAALAEDEMPAHSAQAAAGVREFLRQLWKSDWAGGRDCAPWDCTFAERDRDRADDRWGLEVGPVERAGRTWYRSYAGGMTVADGGGEGQPGFHRPETYWSLSPLTFTAHLIGHFDYATLQPPPSFLPSAPPVEEKKGEDQQPAASSSSSMASLPATWWANDGVVPLASQFHPFDCHPDRCRHFSGMPASLPFGKRRLRPQSTDLTLSCSPRLSAALTALSPASETATLVDVQDDPALSHEQSNKFTLSLPAPVTQAKGGNRTMLGSARSAAKIAYLTSLRAINMHDAPLVTPSDDELRAFLPDLASTAENSTATPTTPPVTLEQVRDEKEAAMRELLDPRDNQWYTFEIDNLDHTSLCPFWTGSEVQKQFWTGIGWFLASVDRKVGFSVEAA